MLKETHVYVCILGWSYLSINLLTYKVCLTMLQNDIPGQIYQMKKFTISTARTEAVLSLNRRQIEITTTEKNL